MQFWEGVDTPVGVQTTGLWFRQCRKLWIPQVQCSDEVGRPCDMQRRDVSQLEVPQIQSADIPVATETDTLSAWVTAMNGVFVHFGHFFALLRVVPEFECQFLEPSMMKSSSSLRAQGWRGRRESDSQAFCHVYKLVSVTDVASPMFCGHTHPSSSL